MTMAPADVVYETKEVDAMAYLSTLEEIAAISSDPDYRANVPEGTPLAEQEIEGSDGGGMVRWRKRGSMIRAGNTPLPERVMLWNKVTQRGSLVPPTIATKRLTSGTREFPPSVFTVRDPGFPAREPIAETCSICDKQRAQHGAGPRHFYDLYQLEAHMQILHPREYATEQRRREQEDKLNDRAEMRELITSIVSAMRPDIFSGEDTSAAEADIVNKVEAQINGPVDIEAMPYRELQKLATSKGIKAVGVPRATLIAELRS